MHRKKEKEIKNYVKKVYATLAEGGNSCCPGLSGDPGTVGEALSLGYSAEEIAQVPQESLMGLGCGNPTALINLKEGQIVLDLGSGAGMDTFLAAQKVGRTGLVIGVDMTEEMAQRAHSTARHYGYKNIHFVLGEIENLPFEDGSVDVMISNCVINLSPDKAATFQEVYRVLRPGGYAMVSDLVILGEISDHLRKSFEAWAGCIAGAAEKQIYLDIIKEAGFHNVTVLSERVFFELGLSRPSGGSIKSIQVRADKSMAQNEGYPG